MIRLPLKSTLFPYTTLFRSVLEDLRTCVDPADRCRILRGKPRWDRAAPIGAVRTGNEAHAVIAKRVVRRFKPVHIDLDRKSTRLNSSHRCISYAVFCLKKKK